MRRRASIGATDLDGSAGEELAGPERAEGEGPGRSDVQLITDVHAFVGDDASALETLQRTVDAGLYDLFWFERCPLLEALRAAPPYARMLRAMRDRVDPVDAALDAPP